MLPHGIPLATPELIIPSHKPLSTTVGSRHKFVTFGNSFLDMMMTFIPPSVRRSPEFLGLGFLFTLRRFAIYLGLILALSAFCSPEAKGQSYGPPAVSESGSLYTYIYTAYDETLAAYYDAYLSEFGDVYRIYADGQVRNAFYSVIGSYDSTSYTFNIWNTLAVTTDGNAINPPPAPYIIAYNPNSPSGVGLILAGVNYSVFGGGFTAELDYIDPTSGSNWFTIHRCFTGGSLSGDVSGGLGGETFSGTYSGNVNDDTVMATALTDQNFNPANVSFYFSANNPTSTTRDGPPYISWNGILLTFAFTDSEGINIYQNDTGTVVVNLSSGSVWGSGPSGSVSGTYDRSTKEFSANVVNFFGLDDNRNPIGLPTGLMIKTGFSGFATSILSAPTNSASVVHATYTYQDPTDGTWVAEYTGLAANSRILIADDHGNYNSQIYLTQNTSSQNQIINASAGWPATNLYPSTLYVNNVPCQIQPASQYDTGGSLPRSGGVSYQPSSYDSTVVLSWNWDSVSGWHGYVTGKFGESSPFQGDWVSNSFTNLTGGVTVSVASQGSQPSYGPPQVAVNGVTFNYDPSSAGQGVDTYRGALGQSVSISGSNVTFYDANGNVVGTGTYNSATHQFSFGGGGNTISIPGTGGTTTVTATDSQGHNLASVTTINGELDVPGNSFTLGTWVDWSGVSIPGFSLSFTPPTDNPAMLRFGSPIAYTSWVWSHAVTDGASEHQPVMQLDPYHRLLLFSPTDGNNPTIIFDPAGGSVINGPIQIAPQGDILMGEFGN